MSSTVSKQTYPPIQTIGELPVLANGQTIPAPPAVRAGDYLFLSGQLGLDERGALAGKDVAAQTRQCFVRIRAILQQAGCDLDRVVKAAVFLTDPADFPTFNAAYRAEFSGAVPARSTVVSGLLIPGARVEIEVMAYLGPAGAPPGPALAGQG